MKKFNFSLQKVLEIKEQLLKNLKNELSNMNEQMKNIETDIRNLTSKYKNTNVEFIEKSSSGITSGEISYFKMFMNTILKSIEKKEADKLLLNKKIEDKRHEIINMNMEISSLEKLKDKEYEKYNHSLTKSEELFIDEFVSNTKMLKLSKF